MEFFPRYVVFCKIFVARTRACTHTRTGMAREGSEREVNINTAFLKIF